MQSSAGYQIVTLNEFIINRQGEHPEAKGDLSRLLHHIGIAAKIVNKKINKAGLVDILGKAGEVNVQGEDVKKLDVFANDHFMAAIKASGEVCAVASEENQEIITFDEGLSREGHYIVCMDPLDGSSNIEVNVSVGTIFSIYRRLSPGGEQADISDFLQPGTRQVAAGYVIYGSSTMLVYTTGTGVDGFTLDPGIGEFCLSHPRIRTPDTGRMYSINEGNYIHFPFGGEEVHQVLPGDRSGHEPAVHVPLYRLTGLRLPPQPADGRHLYLPPDPGRSQGQAATDLRVQSDRLHRRAGGRRGQQRNRPHDGRGAAQPAPAGSLLRGLPGDDGPGAWLPCGIRVRRAARGRCVAPR